MPLQRDLADSQRYLREVDKLYFKQSQSGRLYQLRQDGVPLAALGFDRKRIARTLARTVACGKYELAPARTRWAAIGGKRRLLYEFRLTDRIIHGVVASLVRERLRPRLSPQLYSGVKGRSWWTALTGLSRHVRQHRKSRPDPRTRGLYVLRRDVKEYGDSIPVTDDSPLWPLLREALGVGGDRLSRKLWDLVRLVVRPEVVWPSGAIHCNERGIPTGSPISASLGNLYLMSLDDELSGVPGAYYARYCDDFVFAHPDAEVTRQVASRIGEHLHELQLRANKAKESSFYFNGAGRSSEQWEESRGTSSITFLGCRISFDSTVALSRDKQHDLLRELKRRAGRTRRAISGEDFDATGAATCQALNEALNPRSTLCSPSAALLRYVVTDRAQLKDLDYKIARIVLAVMTRDPSAKAFRRLPYRKIRGEWKLRSLFHARNLVGRSQGR